MTKEQYERWSSAYRKRKNGGEILCKADKMITAVVFLSYPALLLYLFWRGLLGKCIVCIVVPAVSFLLVSVFREIYCAPRPYEVLDIWPLIKKETKGRSFPSRHVFSAFMIAMAFFSVHAVFGAIMGILGMLLAYIRVVGGVHFPKDVVAGALLGILGGLFCFML